MLITKQGKGTFVSKKKEIPLFDRNNERLDQLIDRLFIEAFELGYNLEELIEYMQRRCGHQANDLFRYYIFYRRESSICLLTKNTWPTSYHIFFYCFQFKIGVDPVGFAIFIIITGIACLIGLYLKSTWIIPVGIIVAALVSAV